MPTVPPRRGGRHSSVGAEIEMTAGSLVVPKPGIDFCILRSPDSSSVSGAIRILVKSESVASEATPSGCAAS